MAMELESKVMEEIGLGQHYSWYNGSGSCQYFRDEAIRRLPEACKKNGLTVSPKWLAHCQRASLADNVDARNYGLTNVWIACSYAIQDAIYRSQGGESAGITPTENFNFFDPKDRERWNMMYGKNARYDKMDSSELLAMSYMKMKKG